jgi:hypothetical protein
MPGDFGSKIACRSESLNQINIFANYLQLKQPSIEVHVVLCRRNVGRGCELGAVDRLQASERSRQQRPDSFARIGLSNSPIRLIKVCFIGRDSIGKALGEVNVTQNPLSQLIPDALDKANRREFARFLRASNEHAKK